VDFTDIPIHMKEILFVRINSLNAGEKEEVFRISEVYGIAVIDCDRNSLLLECVQTESKNNSIIKLLQNSFPNRIEVVKGGSVAIEAISVADR
jgi:acetolactate synthase-1/3 small subunit